MGSRGHDLGRALAQDGNEMGGERPGDLALAARGRVQRVEEVRARSVWVGSIVGSRSRAASAVIQAR